MSLWNPGTLEGITPAVLTAVCERAAKDHRPLSDDRPEDHVYGCHRSPCWDGIDSACDCIDNSHACDIAPDQMPIRDIFTPKGDRAFDRVSFAYWRGETVSFDGMRYVIGSYASRWTLHRISSDPACDDRIRLGERELADALTDENGPHPNPHVAVVEVEYNARGNRAGYGIRRDGTAELFYN